VLILNLLSAFWVDHQGHEHYRAEAIDPHSAASLLVESRDNMLSIREEGAVFILLKPSPRPGGPPYSDMRQLVAHNIFPDRFSDRVKNMKFPWVKVEDRPWANGRFKVQQNVFFLIFMYIYLMVCGTPHRAWSSIIW
jgi:aldos-2-ulose dehydratase